MYRLYESDAEIDESRQRRSNSCHPSFSRSESIRASTPNLSGAVASTRKFRNCSREQSRATSIPVFTSYSNGTAIDINSDSDDCGDLPTPTTNSTFQEHVTSSSHFPVLMCPESPICHPPGHESSKVQSQKSRRDGVEGEMMCNGFKPSQYHHTDLMNGVNKDPGIKSATTSDPTSRDLDLSLNDIHVDFTSSGLGDHSTPRESLSVNDSANIRLDNVLNEGDCGGGEGVACSLVQEVDQREVNISKAPSINNLDKLIDKLNLTEEINYSQEIFSTNESNEFHLRGRDKYYFR